jgi:hypothetical protein
MLTVSKTSEVVSHGWYLKRPQRSFFVALALLVTSTLGAQERRQGGPPPYDPTKEVTVSGTVTGTETIEIRGETTNAVLLLTVDGAPMGIILGPAAWVQKQGVTFAAGATVQVVGLTGYKFNGGSAMMPRTVKAGARTLTLRDATGKPAWEQ